MNLLFITADHFRADSIGAMRAGRVVTPHLNALMGNGVGFTRAYSACPLCVPARSALATGLRPARTGVQWNDWDGTHAQSCVTLHEQLAASGYDLGHVGMDHIRLNPRLQERAKFKVWFDETDHGRHLEERGCNVGELLAAGPYRKKVRETVDGRELQSDYSTPHVGEWPFAREDFRDEFFARQAEAAIRELATGSNPFALFVNFWAPHPPLYVPPELLQLFPPEAVKLPSNTGLRADGEPANRREGIAAQLAEGVEAEGWRRAWSAHLALTHLVDELVGRLLETLQQAGVAEDTLVVFTSDHGEHLGQHDLYQKMELYEPAVQVPLIMQGPGLRERRKIQVPVSHLDVMPTVLDLLWVKVPAGLDGRSLGRTARAGVEPTSKPVFTQFTGNSGPSVSRYAVVLGRFKYIRDTEDQAELYDLITDPLEMRNLAGDPHWANVVQDLSGRLDAWLAQPAGK